MSEKELVEALVLNAIKRCIEHNGIEGTKQIIEYISNPRIRFPFRNTLNKMINKRI